MYKQDKLTVNSYILILVTVVYGFHMLRNISALYPLVVIGLSCIFIFLFIRNKIFREYRYIVLFLFFTSVIPIYSYIHFPDVNYLTAISRFFFIYPFVILTLLLMKQQRDYEAIINALLIMVLICCFSLLYQVLFHSEIRWLADPSERSGIIRYSSLAGSLTILGVAGPIAIIFAYYHLQSILLKTIVIAILVVSSVLTIQKAAVINLLLVGVILFFYSSNKHRIIMMLLSIILIGFLFFYFHAYFDQTFGSVFDHSQVKSDDVTVYQSIIQRLWLLPSVLYERYGMTGMLTGVGLAGGGGTFGLSDFPMSHNAVFDFLFIGGVIYLVLFLVLVAKALFTIRRFLKANQDDYKAKASMWVLILLLINMVFSNILYFQPYTGMMFFVTLIYCYGVFRLKNHNVLE